MYRRNIMTALHAALQDSRVVLLHGARQTGKSTLAAQLATERKGRYLSLDDDVLLASVRADPSGFVRTADTLMIIDEVQRAPELLRAIKLEVDRDRRPGRFLLTGSANVLMLPALSESLAGRMEILTLQPLSQDEIQDAVGGFPEALLGARGRPGEHALAPRQRTASRLDVCRRIVAGGFPEALTRNSAERRGAWFRSYLSSLLQRDVRDLANIEGLTDMPRLLALLAARTSSLMNMAEVSRTSGIAHSTLRRYLTLLEMTFVLQPLRSWSSNVGKRLVKSPKIHLIDTGLAAHLTGNGEADALATSPFLGALMESFVVQELRKQLGWSRAPFELYHYRAATGREVDVVIEAPGGRLAGIEVKASATVTRADFAGLDALAETAGKRFANGAVIYLGEQLLPFGESRWAVPLSELWTNAASPAGA